MRNALLVTIALIIFAVPVNGQIIYGKIYLDGNPVSNEEILFLDGNNKVILEEKTNEQGEYIATLLNAKGWTYSKQLYQVVCYKSSKCPQKVFVINLTTNSPGIEANRNIDSCQPFYSLVMKFDALNPKTLSKSPHQDYADLKEDDILNLDELIIQNNADCRINGYDIDLDIKTPLRTISNPFGLSIIEIPPLDHRQWYTLKFKERNIMNIPGEPKEFNIYEPSIDTIVFKKPLIAYLGRQELFDPGAWTFEATSGKSNLTQRTEVNVLLKEESGNIGQTRLKVFGKKDQEALDLSKQSRNIAIIVAIFTSSLTIFAGYLFAKSKERREQKILLSNLRLQLKEVKKTIKGHKEELAKGIIPSYFLPRIKATTYLSSLNFKGLTDEQKINARELIHEIDNKIWTINHLIDKSTDAIVLNNVVVVNSLKKEISAKNFKYHKHLEKMIKQLESIIN